MQINSVSNSSYKPSFGMAKLTRKGTELAQTFVSELPEFIDTTSYKKSNLLKALLKKSSKGAEVDFADFFTAGKTLYPHNNELFIKKQIGAFGAQGAIKRFLKRQATPGTGELTEKGSNLVTQLIELFDVNVSNPEVSSKQGRKILGLVEPYVSTEVLAPRNSIVTNKVFSK